MTKKEIRGYWSIKLIENFDMDCCVLTDWTPMLNLTKLSKAMWRPVRWSRDTELPALIDAKSLQPYVREELKQKLRPIEIDNQLLYEAEVLPMICNVYLEARLAGDLTSKQIWSSWKMRGSC